MIDVTHLPGAEKRAYLDALEAAIFTGVDYVSYAGDQAKYRSLDDMIRIRDMLRRELGLPVASGRRRTHRAIFRVGHAR